MSCLFAVWDGVFPRCGAEVPGHQHLCYEDFDGDLCSWCVDESLLEELNA